MDFKGYTPLERNADALEAQASSEKKVEGPVAPARSFKWGLRAAGLVILYFVTITSFMDRIMGCAYSPERQEVDEPLGSPTRPLTWGDVNFIHTTDTHGWLLGHQKKSQPEPNASGTFGDLYSFVYHMKRMAKEKGVDLLLVDSGDLHDGNGLSDGFPPGSVNGHETNKFFAQFPYDALAVGNHELYKYPVALDVHRNFAPKWGGRYLSSNINITTVSPNGESVSVPLGDRYVKFKTALGRRVTALGVLFDFHNNAANTTVQRVEDFVAETWFLKAIEEEPDFFLMLGHMSVADENWIRVFATIRKRHPSTPIFIFGGHTHIRDCRVLDDNAIVMASGRYLETVGWMSATLPSPQDPKTTFTRRYLDANRATYKYHTGKTSKAFDTRRGMKITQGLHELSKRFNLDAAFGVAPQDYYLDRVPYGHNNSVVSFYVNNVLPVVLPPSNPDRLDTPSIIIANSGAQRFDVFKGPFTRNDQFIVSPFVNQFLYLNLPFGIARRILDRLNHYGAFSLPAPDAEVHEAYSMWKRDQWTSFQHLRTDEDGRELTLGYVTADSCPGGPGDDTPHAPIPYYDQPGYVSHTALPDSTSNSTLVDVIFFDFFSAHVVLAVNELRLETKDVDVPQGRNLTTGDIKVFSNVRTNEVLGLFARAMWNSTV